MQTSLYYTDSLAGAFHEWFKNVKEYLALSTNQKLLSF